MNKRIQLKHPAGKKAVSMDSQKYQALKKEILLCLKTNGASTHKEILNSVSKNFKKNKTKFSGSIEWHMEWVKLDLEAGKKIKRYAENGTSTFSLAGK